ncbi:hypothetical protein H4217_008999 [Coemansia sp. RSA 1939]|nr:hypothetical protein H4217_008999 [Coemansia sp. RSA 1939]
MAPSGIAALPDDVLFRIFALCNGDDLRSLSEVNRAFRAVAQDGFLWKVIYRKRFYSEPDSGSRPCQDQYNDRDCLALSVADSCEIVHGHPPYWRFSVDSRSVFGKVALLNGVSWLSVQGRLQGVHTGKYRAVWRLFVLPHARNIFDIRFSAQTSLSRTVEGRLPPNASLLEFGSDYFDFVIPGVLVVKAPFENVLLECTCTSREWKTNIALCSARLEPVDDTPRARRARARVMIGNALTSQNNVDARKQLRRLGNSRLQPGAAYNLWKPWSTAGGSGH